MAKTMDVASVEEAIRRHRAGESLTAACNALGVSRTSARIHMAKVDRPAAEPVETIDLSTLVVLPEVQSREHLDVLAVEDYAAIYAEGGPTALPPIVVYRLPDGRLILAAGFHRYRGARDAGIAELPAHVREGTLDDAKRHSIGENTTHGVRRTAADKRRAIRMALSLPALEGVSDREIGRECGVDSKTVAAVRKEASIVRDRVKASDGRSYPASRGGSIAEFRNANPSNDGTPDPPSRVPSVNGNGHHAGNSPVAVADAPEKSQAEKDRDYLESIPARDRVKGRCQRLFDADALAFRAVAESPEFAAIRKVIGKHLDAKTPGVTYGPYKHLIRNFVKAKSPREWAACPECNGDGDARHPQTGARTGDCPSCRGSGYNR